MIRVGLGYDLHRLIEGRKLLLGGIELPFEKVKTVILTVMCFFTLLLMPFLVQADLET